MNGCIYRTQSDLCKLYTKAGDISFCKGEDCPDRKQSNADRIRGMTDEELADYMAFVGKVNKGCPVMSINCQESCNKCWLDWLKEEEDE